MDSLNFIFNEDLIKSKLLSFDSLLRLSIKDEFFTPSAILFTIIPYEHKPYELVLIHRTDKGTKHRGEMSFPGGKVDPRDKNLEVTALRECEEEIGVPRSNITILGCLNDLPTMSRYIISPFVGYISKDQKLVKDDREVQEIVKVPINFFFNTLNFREQTIEIGYKKLPVFYYDYITNNKKYLIWGATAYLISTFIEIIYGYTLSKLGIRRFNVEEIKPLKNYIKLRKKLIIDTK